MTQVPPCQSIELSCYWIRVVSSLAVTASGEACKAWPRHATVHTYGNGRKDANAHTQPNVGMLGVHGMAETF